MNIKNNINMTFQHSDLFNTTNLQQDKRNQIIFNARLNVAISYLNKKTKSTNGGASIGGTHSY